MQGETKCSCKVKQGIKHTHAILLFQRYHFWKYCTVEEELKLGFWVDFSSVFSDDWEEKRSVPEEFCPEFEGSNSGIMQVLAVKE